MFKYEVIAEDIQNKIQKGVYRADEKLPQEMELCKQYDASRITVREALDLLVYRGLITRRRGFARSQQFGGFSRDNEGREVTSVIHAFTLMRAPAEVAERLQISGTSVVCYICRTRLVDGYPHVVEYTYMPTDFIIGITEDVLKGYIYSYIEQELKLKIKSAHRVVRADLPDEQEREWLKIGTRQLPILEVEQTAYLDDGRIFEYSKSRHRADCFELQSVSVRS